MSVKFQDPLALLKITPGTRPTFAITVSTCIVPTIDFRKSQITDDARKLGEYVSARFVKKFCTLHYT